MEHEHNHHEQEAGMMQEYWDKENPLLQKLYAGVENYVMSISGIGRAFHLDEEDREALCIDGRLMKERGIRIAGCAILLGDKAEETLRAARPKKLSSHAACGAAAEAYKQLSEEERAKYKDADAYAIAWTSEMAERLGLPEPRHIAVEPKFHNERAIYYSGVDVNLGAVGDALPTGFIINANYLETAKGDLDFAVSIAFGSHGFGDRFDEQNPLLIVPIGDPTNPEFSLDKLMKEAQEVASKYGGRVKVDGFSAPRKKDA